MEFNWLRSGREAGLFRHSACAAARRAFSVSARRHAAGLARKALSLAAWSAGACAACCWTKPRRWPFGFGFLARGFLGGFLRFLLHAHGFSLGGFGLLASLLGFLTALRFRYGVGVGLGFAFFGGSLVRGDSCLSIFLGLLLYGHDASFFGGFDDLAGGSYDVFLLALARVNFFRVAELLFALASVGAAYLLARAMCAMRMELRASKSSSGSCGRCKRWRFRFWCWRKSRCRADKLVAGVDVFDFAERGGTKNVFQHDGVTGLIDGRNTFGGDDHAKGLHLGDGFHFTTAIF